MLLGGVAYAGRGHGHGGKRHHGGGGGGVVVRDHRGPVQRGPVVRDHRAPRVKHNHIRYAKGRYVFPGGVVRVYKRPVIRHRYYDVHVRPAVIVEAYDPVPGYIWVQGHWNWGGAEWIWVPGYYSVETVAVEPPSASVSVGASFSIR
jgi:hypothetical protein